MGIMCCIDTSDEVKFCTIPNVRGSESKSSSSLDSLAIASKSNACHQSYYLHLEFDPFPIHAPHNSLRQKFGQRQHNTLVRMRDKICYRRQGKSHRPYYQNMFLDDEGWVLAQRIIRASSGSSNGGTTRRSRPGKIWAIITT